MISRQALDIGAIRREYRCATDISRSNVEPFGEGPDVSRTAWCLPLVLLLATCGSDSPLQPETHALAGSWTVESWVWTHELDASFKADWVQTRGLTGTLLVAADGRFTATPALPSGFGTDDGELTIVGTRIYWDGQNDEEWVPFTLTATHLAVEWPETEHVDMDQDGHPEDAWLRVVFRRQ
jgi:hypothetical protein